MARVSTVCDYVSDGDTFKTKMGTWIRLNRVDAPKGDTPEGRRATDILKPLILNKAITHESVATDAYGRLVAEVWVDNLNVNDNMIAQGYHR